MKKITFLFLLFSALAFSQSLQPTIGGRYTGGLSYDFEHEYFSGQIGFLYTPKNKLPFADFFQLSGEYTYDYAKEYDRRDENFYIIRAQASKYFSDQFAFTYYGGYFGGFKVNMKNNFAWGLGVQLVDDSFIIELLYENIAGFPHVSIGVNFPLWQLIK